MASGVAARRFRNRTGESKRHQQRDRKSQDKNNHANPSVLTYLRRCKLDANHCIFVFIEIRRPAGKSSVPSLDNCPLAFVTTLVQFRVSAQNKTTPPS